MLLIDAIKKAEKDSYVKKLMSENYFLCSCFASVKDGIKEWILHFYSPRKKKIIDCFVSEPDKSVTLGEETPAMKKMQKLDISKVTVSADQALEIAKNEFKKKATSILITMHKKKEVVWTINMITANMVATSYDIDSSSGKILSEKTISLIKTFSINSKYEDKF